MAKTKANKKPRSEPKKGNPCGIRSGFLGLHLGSICMVYKCLYVLLFSCVLAAVGACQTFTPGCSLRFQQIAVKHPIDDICSIDGKLSLPEPQRLQNIAKNNFCAPDPATSLQFEDFVDLQKAAAAIHVQYGGSQLPASRSPLRHLSGISGHQGIGEGVLVRLAAFIQDAHAADIRTGESVNCNIPGVENNDLHVNLVESLDDDLCKSITAEVSPHMRPQEWMQLTQMGQIGRPVRVTGQLFFDASHRPCQEGGRAPRRASNWEIHPVYAIDVCSNDSLERCHSGDETVWTSLHAWKNTATSPTRLGITIKPPIVKAGTTFTVEVSLLNSQNQPSSWKQDTPIKLTVQAQSPPERHEEQFVIGPGQSSGSAQVQVTRPGIYSIAAVTPQLRGYSIFINILPAEAHKLRTLRPGLLDVALKGFDPVNPLSTSALQTQRSTRVRIQVSPSREIAADGFDAATISAFVENDPQHSDIPLNLHASLGQWDLCVAEKKPSNCTDIDLIIPTGIPGAEARLTSTRKGDVQFVITPASADVELDNLVVPVEFGPPITKIYAEASPPEITLVDNSQLMVKLTDEKGVAYVPNHPKKIYIAIKKGWGKIDSADSSISVIPPNPVGSAGFIPGFGIGKMELVASTDELQSATVLLTVKAPVWFLLISLVGGLVGGCIFVLMDRKSSRWRIVIGAVTGFILYWAIAFGIVSIKSSFLILNPLSDFSISVIGGWIGTQVFTVILKQFGFASQPSAPGP